MTRIMLYALAGGLVAIIPLVSQVHAQMSEDTRIQLFQGGVTPTAPGTRPIGPAFQRFGGDSGTDSRSTTLPRTEPDRPPLGFGPAGTAPNVGETTIPSVGMGRYGAGASSAER
jgi:hypothetical protein